jgi:hypothetical protein
VRTGVATDPDLDHLATALAEVTDGTITWELRQLAFQRT